MSRFTDRELAIAKSVDLVDVASYMGYTPKRIGRYYTLKEMDSIRIYNRSHWFRWSMKGIKGEDGGSQIDFLRVFGGMNAKDAVFWLLDFSGYKKPEDEKNNVNKNDANKNNYGKENYYIKNNPALKHQIKLTQKEEKIQKKEFILPEPAIDNSNLYQYLFTVRGLSYKVIDYFIAKNLIYESKERHNVIFKGNDKAGVTRFASMRGIVDYKGKPFKCDVTGNDKNYGFNIWNDDSTEVVVFEAAIDLMSYVDIYNDYDSNKIALGMLGDAPLLTFLREHPWITTIRFCLDNDNPGRTTVTELMEKYKQTGYEVIDSPAPAKYKDYNEWLVDRRIKENTIKNMPSIKH